ncbi:MAG: hypothetical protein JNK46_08350 [Methylobacteriaceae bacterium]|nr:hypothetical protein [Methylobacteriaceae bacterium]
MAGGLSLAICAVAAASRADAQRDGVADALAGHQAEMRQLAGEDPYRRAFFFDAVEVESPNPGVPCDHIASRRPEAVAGQGRVVLLESASDPARRLRFWAAPDFDQGADAVAAAIAFAQSAKFGPHRVVGMRQFAWCR